MPVTELLEHKSIMFLLYGADAIQIQAAIACRNRLIQLDCTT